jgi:hypothetical protein
MSSASLPALYANWVAEWLGGSIPAETEATCENCVLLAESSQLYPESSRRMPANDLAHRVYPHTKCCVYYPSLPNFLVGRILNETVPTDVPARDVVEARIQGRFMATPLALDIPPAYKLLSGKPRHPGISVKLRCPYYVEELLGGVCGIRQQRNAYCLTWFCKHVRGQVGAAFWNALYLLLQHLENALSVWSLTQLEISDDSLAQILPDHREEETIFALQQVDEIVDDQEHRARWGNWAGREAEFYRECGRLVSALSAERALEIGGAEAALRLRVARKAFGALLATSLPRAVRPGDFRVKPLGNDQLQIIAYRESAPLLLPAVVLNLLPYFEGRSVDEALKMIDEQEQIEMEPALVRKLVDFEILVPAE